MSPEGVSILALVGLFAIGTGALAFPDTLSGERFYKLAAGQLLVWAVVVLPGWGS